MAQQKLRWMRLDNAALIFPAALRRTWSNAFRISFSFTDPVDPEILQQALDHTVQRFPSVCVRLRRGLFWYYLEELPSAPRVAEDSYQPLRHMGRRDVRRCGFRVLYYRNRMAVEYFHSVTDGTGGLTFAKTLAAEYVRLYFGVEVPAQCGIKELSEDVPAAELEDSFRDNGGPVAAARDDRNVYRPKDALEPDRYLHVTQGELDAEALHSLCAAKGVTVTAFLTAVLLDCLMEMQRSDVRNLRHMKPVKVQIPVNLRKLFPSETMRNFTAVANVGADPRLGDYTLDELVEIVHHQMRLSITKKNMQAIFTPNVRDERNVLLKIVPLAVKNLVMRMVFDNVGETVSCLSFSNLGRVELPEAMAKYVQRVEFVLGAQSSAPHNVSATSFGGKLWINISRNSVEPRLERLFFTRLVQLGLHVRIEDNAKE